MRKFLVMLMVIAMASFLFVGCQGVTPDIPDPDNGEEEPEPEPVLPATVAPIITSVPDIAGGYINKVAAANGIVVNGTAPTYSEVKVYINGLTAGTGDAGFNGVFQVVVAKVDLIKAVKTDGAKVLYATATEVGKTESPSSNVKKFTLDTARPTIKKSSAKAGIEAVLFVPGEATVTGPAVRPVPNFFVTLPDVVTGTWTVNVTSSAQPNNVVITDPDGNVEIYSCVALATFAAGAPIPGVAFQLKGPLNPLESSQIICKAEVAEVPAVPGYIDVTFNEPVKGTSILAPPAGTGVWTAFCATWNLNPNVTVRGAEKARLTETAATIPNLVAGRAYSVSCSGVRDLAGNTIPASSPETCTGVVLP